MKHETTKQRLQELAAINKPAAIREDYSTMSLKSNIDQKWKSADDLAGDMQQWLSGIYSGNPTLYNEAMDILANIADNFDPMFDDDEM